MKFQLEVDYENGSEVYELSDEERNKILQHNRINLNAAIHIAKKRRFFPKEKTGDIKE